MSFFPNISKNIVTPKIVNITQKYFWTSPKNLGGPIDLPSYVRTYVRPYVRTSDGFRSNHSIVFSDFWHQGSFLWFQKTDEAGFLKKKFFWPKMAKKV